MLRLMAYFMRNRFNSFLMRSFLRRKALDNLQKSPKGISYGLWITKSVERIGS
jgi:hypothetical protein